MIDQVNPAKVIEEMGTKFSELLQNTPARDVEKNVKAMFTAALARLDLVTREEFEVQKALLASTREKLEALEKRVIELESKATPPTE